MTHTVRINKTIWEMLAEEAARRCTRPSRIIDLAIRKELGVEPKWNPEAVPCDTEDLGPEEEDEEEFSPLQSNLAGDLKEIRLWQAKLKQAEDEYDGYHNGVAEEDWDLEQRSDYVIDCANRIEESRAKLRELIPTIEQPNEHGNME